MVVLFKELLLLLEYAGIPMIYFYTTGFFKRENVHFIIDFQLLHIQCFSIFLQQSVTSHSDIYDAKVITFYHKEKVL